MVTKIKIDAGGYLWLKRAEEWRAQYCPFAYEGDVKCGDWCPLFSEPSFYNEGEDKTVYIEICNGGTLGGLAKDFVDERGE